jgi:hypothetical protein
MKRLVILATFTLVMVTSGVVMAAPCGSDSNCAPDERVTSTPPLGVTAPFKTVAAVRNTLNSDCVEPDIVYSRQQRPQYVSA